jgi:RNA polymerase sigma-70 factor (ECF subfamily)
VAFIAANIHTPGLRYIHTQANGQPAIGWYLWDADRRCFTAAAIEVYSYAGERLTQITAFASPDLFQRFGLPAKLAAQRRRRPRSR